MKIKFCGIKTTQDVEAANNSDCDYVGFVLTPSKRQIDLQTLKKLSPLVKPKIKKVGVFVNPTYEELDTAKDFIDVIQLHGNEDKRFVEKAKLFFDKELWKVIHIECEMGMNLQKMQPEKNETLEMHKIFGGRTDMHKIFDEQVEMHEIFDGQAGKLEKCDEKPEPQPEKNEMRFAEPEKSGKQIGKIESQLDSAFYADKIIFDSAVKNNWGGTGCVFDWQIVSDLALKFRINKPFFIAGGIKPENILQISTIPQIYGADISGGIETKGKKDFKKMIEIMEAIK